MTKPSATERVLEIELPRERLEKIFEDKLKKYGREIRVNGFRPGNVPRQVILSRYKEPITAEALEALVDEAVREACKEHALEPVGPGKVEKLDNVEGKPIFVKALLEVDPPVELKEYRFDIPVNPAPVSEAAVENQLQGFRRQMAQETAVDRLSQSGDVVASRYLRIQIEGREQPLPQHPVFRVELGQGGIPELDKALTGVKAGETRDAAFKFPADYANPALAGKPSAYTLAIEQVLEVKLPELDDDLAKILAHESLAAMRVHLKSRMEAAELQKAKESAWDEAIGRLLSGHALEVPKIRIRNYVLHRLEEMGHHHTPEEERAHDHGDLEREAQMQIRRWRLLDAIAAKENIKPAQEEVDARIRRMAERYGAKFEELKASLRKSGKILDLREEVKAEKTLDFVIGYKAAT